MALLENEKIHLRALEPEDLEPLYRWENNPDLWGVGNTLSPFSRYILREYIAESHQDIFEAKQLRLMIELCSTGAAVGMVDLYDLEVHHRRAGIGILLDPIYQGNGLATEAVNLMVEYAYSLLNLHQLYAYVPVKNEPSKALFTRCGFTITGILSDWIAIEGGYSDVIAMQRINKR